MNSLESESLEFLLSQMIRMHHNRTQELLNQFNLYPGQPRILFMLIHRDGRTQKEFADASGVKAATITVTLRRMEKAGLIERRPDPNDLRATRVFITPKGVQTAKKARTTIDQLSEACFTGFNDTDKALMRRFLLQMRDNLNRNCSPK